MANRSTVPEHLELWGSMFVTLTILLFSTCGGIRLTDNPDKAVADAAKIASAEARGDLLSLIDQTASSSTIAFAVLEDLLWALRDGGTYDGPLPKIGPKAWPIVRALHALLVIRRDGVMTATEVLEFQKTHSRKGVIAFHLTTGDIKPSVDAELSHQWHAERGVLSWARARRAEPIGADAIAEYWVTRDWGNATTLHATIRMGNQPDFWAKKILSLLEANTLAPRAAKYAAAIWVRLQRHRLAYDSTPPTVITDWRPRWNLQIPRTIQPVVRMAMTRPARIYTWTYR